MYGLTLTQPWATLLARGHKRFETRGWRPNPKRVITPQLIAIHAAAKYPKACRQLAETYPFKACLPGTLISGAGTEKPLSHIQGAVLPVGAIIGVALLYRCIRTEDVMRDPLWKQFAGDHEAVFGNYQCGRWAWYMADATPLEAPIPFKGALNLWTVPAPVLAAIRFGLRGTRMGQQIPYEEVKR